MTKYRIVKEYDVRYDSFFYRVEKKSWFSWQYQGLFLNYEKAKDSLSREVLPDEVVYEISV